MPDIRKEYFTPFHKGARVARPIARKDWLALFSQQAATIKDGQCYALVSRTHDVERWERVNVRAD